MIYGSTEPLHYNAVMEEINEEDIKKMAATVAAAPTVVDFIIYPEKQ